MSAPSRPLTLAILPVKRFAAAKARLGDEISSGTRRALAESMVTDVLMALRRTDAVDGVFVVTSEPTADAIGRGYGATVLVDDVEDGQSAATLIGIDHAVEQGAGRVLLVPGDCPALDPGELSELLERAVLDPSVIIVPDRHGTGTNALILTPPDIIEPAFGPDSRARHEQLAQAAGVPCEVAPSRRWRSTSTPRTTSRRCARRSPTAAAAPRTRAACSAASPDATAGRPPGRDLGGRAGRRRGRPCR